MLKGNHTILNKKLSNTAANAMKTPAPTTVSFGDYYNSFFSQRFPHLASHLRPEQASFAANVYLFRHDKTLSMDFIRSHVDGVAKSIASISGRSLLEARCLFTAGTEEAAKEYFAGDWGDTTRFVRANIPSLHFIHYQNARHRTSHINSQREGDVVEVNPNELQSIINDGITTLVLVFAKYCSRCKQVRPLFDRAARVVGSSHRFVTLNGPSYPDVNDWLQVHTYPTILRFTSTADSAEFPSKKGYSVENLVSFAQGDSKLGNELTHRTSVDSHSDVHASPQNEAEHAQFQWAATLRSHGIDELESLVNERNRVLNSEINKAFQCDDVSCAAPTTEYREANGTASSPVCILLGGGMGAGKTSVVSLISTTKFWRRTRKGVVVIEADAFKQSDPLFEILQSVTPDASHIVHKDSIEAAEKLLLKAVSDRRDIVFDGTLSWCEYARQTIAMLRDCEYIYKRGPGHCRDSSGRVVEQYWMRAEERKVRAPPYRIELVGVTADADEAVLRGIVRRITSGRGVPVYAQLRSHALFSKFFEQYLEMVDSAYLFDTTPQGKEHDGLERPALYLVAARPGLLFEMDSQRVSSDSGHNTGDEFRILDASAYANFLRKEFLNVKATRAADLFSTNDAR